MSVRRWASVLCCAALTTAGLTAFGAAPAAASAAQIVHQCAQHLPAGRYSCFAERRVEPTASRTGVRTAQRVSSDGLEPADLRSAYGLTDAAASTTVVRPRVYVVDAYDAPKAEQDLKQYRARFGLPACTTGNGCFQKLNQSGAVAPLPRADANWAGETALDLDMVSAVCPRCDITLVEANRDDNNLLAAVHTATSLGARFVSMSWGGVEDGNEPSYDRMYFTGANGNGTGVFYGGATGDDGLGATYPATSPRVVAVGGTNLQAAGNARGWAEKAWQYSQNNGGPGSGCSSDEAKPSWQSGVVASSVCARRAEADVSAIADPATGVAVFNSYYDVGWSEYGGTSAAAPIVAAAAALAGVPQTSTTPASVIYAHTSGLNDITTGGANSSASCATSLCRAGPGWDGPTGLGTLNGLSALTPGANSAAHIVRLGYPGAHAGRVGSPARLQLTGTSSPDATLTYTARGLPPGVRMSTSGLITGTPTRAGDYAPVVIATDGQGGRSSTSFRWPVTLVCSARPITNGGFESGAKTWTASKGIVHRLAKRAHSGAHFVRLDGRGRKHTDKLSRSVALPIGCSATLSYYLKVTTKDHGAKAHDRMQVAVNGHPLQSRTNRSAGAKYRRITLNLTRYNGRRVTLSWIGRENGSKATSFYLDDLWITLRK